MTVRTSTALMLSRLVVPFSVKADDVDQESRTFEGLAATWDLDLGNDIIKKGAFKQTLKEWKSSGEAIPLLNSHDHFDIFSALGQLVDAKETDEGLHTKWEVIDGPDGDRVLQRLRPSKTTGRPIIGKMSIGYEPIEFSFKQPENGSDSFSDRIRILKTVKLAETSLVLFPMQPGASIDASSVKAFNELLTKARGQKLDAMTAKSLRQLASRIGLVLAGGKAGTDDTAPSGSKVKPPTKQAPNVDALTDDDDDSLNDGDANSNTRAPSLLTDDDSDDNDSQRDDDNSEHTDDDSESKQSLYLYDDALKQRMMKALQKRQLSAHDAQ